MLFFQLNGNRILYKIFCIFAADQYSSFFFLPCFVQMSVLFLSNPCILNLKDDLFQNWGRVELSSLPRTALWLRGRGGGQSPHPHWWEGAVAGCMRLYWKRNLCCSNSFFCCSLDCQDVLNISVLWAWCFNKKKDYLCNRSVRLFIIWGLYFEETT